MILQRYAIVLLVVMGLAWVPRGTWAGCYSTSSLGVAVTFQGPFQLDSESPTGKVIAVSDLVAIPGSNKVHCKPGKISNGFQSSFPGYDHDNIFGTRLSDAIVMRIKDADTGVYLNAYPGQPIEPSPGGYILRGTNFLVELVQQGVADTSLLEAGPLGSLKFGSNDGNFESIPFRLSQSVRLVFPACRVDAPSNISVQLPPVSVTEFKGEGSTKKATQIKIGITCPFLDPGGRKAMLVFESNAKSARVRGVLLPAAEVGSATGVGVQLLDDSQLPIEFDKPINIGKSARRTFDLTYSARYYQTGSFVTAGTVKATVTLTLKYL